MSKKSKSCLYSYGLGVDTNTHAQTHAYPHESAVISKNQTHAGLRPACIWFKNTLLRIYIYVNDLTSIYYLREYYHVLFSNLRVMIEGGSIFDEYFGPNGFK